MNTYRCRLFATVIAKDGEADFETTVDLPFVPVPGMTISVNGRSPTSFFVDIVDYLVPDGEFWLEMAEPDEVDHGCGCEPGEGCCTLDRSIGYYVEEDGWSLQRIRRGFERRHQRPWVWEPDKWEGSASHVMG